MSTDDAPRLRMPDLRFVPVDALIPHEQHDPNRSGPLLERLREQGVLRNPPIVTPLTPAEDRFVVLDGANRAIAAVAAGLPHMVVQVVSYDDPGVRLTTWHHALSDFPAGELERALGAIPGLACLSAELTHARAVLARREAIAMVALAGGRAITLHGGGELAQRNALLNAVVDGYRSRARFYRWATDSFADAHAEHDDVTALVVFPHFEPAELLEIAMSGAKLPAGVTRHVIAWRALRINMPIDKLADARTPLAEKNRWLKERLREKVLQRQVRFYQESTVLLDE